MKRTIPMAMRPWGLRTPALLAILAAGCYSAPDRSVSEWKPGGWRPARTTTGQPKVPAPKLQADSRKAFDSGAYLDAAEGYLTLKERYPETAEAKDVSTSFFIAESHYRLGEGRYVDAYPFYLEVLKSNPTQEMLQTSLGRIYDIGIAFLYGRAKRSFLGISYRSPTYGVDILTGDQGLVTNYPFLPQSEDALMEVAKYFFDGKGYAEAEPYYERISRDYPQSRWHQSADYQLALSIHKQIKGVEYDQTLMVKARSKFIAYVSHYPRGDHVEEARSNLRILAEWEGDHDLRIAKYYLRESSPQAAKLYLRSVFINNPKTDAAREAREIYENLEKRRGGI